MLQWDTDRTVRFAACGEHVAEALDALGVTDGSHEVVVARDVHKDPLYKCSCGAQAHWFLSVGVIEER